MEAVLAGAMLGLAVTGLIYFTGMAIILWLPEKGGDGCKRRMVNQNNIKE